MRVKLSYTVEEESILTEAAKILGLSGEDMQHCIQMFQEVQKELKGPEGLSPNTIKALEMIEDFRKALLSVDTRLSEVAEIIEGYNDYRRNKNKPQPPGEENTYQSEMFGAD